MGDVEGLEGMADLNSRTQDHAHVFGDGDGDSCVLCGKTLSELVADSEQPKQKEVVPQISYPSRGAPYLCPVCLGKGKVPCGFYDGVGGEFGLSTTSACPETCRTCKGEGVLWSGGVVNSVLEFRAQDVQDMLIGGSCPRCHKTVESCNCPPQGGIVLDYTKEPHFGEPG